LARSAPGLLDAPSSPILSAGDAMILLAGTIHR